MNKAKLERIANALLSEAEQSADAGYPYRANIAGLTAKLRHGEMCYDFYTDRYIDTNDRNQAIDYLVTWLKEQ